MRGLRARFLFRSCSGVSFASLYSLVTRAFSRAIARSNAVVAEREEDGPAPASASACCAPRRAAGLGACASSPASWSSLPERRARSLPGAGLQSLLGGCCSGEAASASGSFRFPMLRAAALRESQRGCD